MKIMLKKHLINKPIEKSNDIQTIIMQKYLKSIKMIKLCDSYIIHKTFTVNMFFMFLSLQSVSYYVSTDFLII
jgi:hypothetical protein